MNDYEYVYYEDITTASWVNVFVIIPKRCCFSGRWLVGRCLRTQRAISGPDLYFEDVYAHPDELALAKLAHKPQPRSTVEYVYRIWI